MRMHGAQGQAQLRQELNAFLEELAQKRFSSVSFDKQKASNEVVSPDAAIVKNMFATNVALPPMKGMLSCGFVFLARLLIYKTVLFNRFAHSAGPKF